MPRTNTQSPICICCGRRFGGRLSRAEGLDLCELCYEEAGEENAHQDGHHDLILRDNGQMEPDVSNAHCHICNETDPHANIRTRTASGQQGKVLTDTDRRLRVNAPALPENAEKVLLKGLYRGRANARYVGEATVIQRSTHNWQGHNSWVLAVPDNAPSIRRWFRTDDTDVIGTDGRPVRQRAPRRSRATAAAAE